MRFARFGAPGQEKPAVLDARGELRDLSSIVADISGPDLANGLREVVGDIDVMSLPTVDVSTRLGPCVGNVGKVVALGLNYTEHAREGGREIPTEPLLFMKPTSSLSGPNDPIILPKGSKKTDWEVELAVIIGKRARYVDESAIGDYIAGYALFNDVSERDHQLNRGGQWVKGKGHDSFGPIGPWLVTADEVGDPQNINLWLDVDGHRYQDANTADMIFSVSFSLSYISQFMTLNPGDVVITGTPAGVGNGLKPEPRFLSPGQEVELSGSGLGKQTHLVVSGN